ncbi:kinase-like domain-containing protein [Gautieria morchelliformis]|nr:kinase-like domain-containing protein [Gautieria morchelliformis]
MRAAGFLRTVSLCALPLPPQQFLLHWTLYPRLPTTLVSPQVLPQVLPHCQRNRLLDRVTAAAPMSSALCQQVGHWRVSKEVIGNGTTSTVRLASHATIPTLCAAVKIISRTGLLIKAEGDPGALHLADAVIDREVLLTKIASHERIVKLYNFVADGDLAYMILEHAPNKTLFDLFHSHSSFLSPVFITHLFSQLMQAVDHIHSLHIVHRDIKLENLFLFGPDIKDIILQADSTHGRNRKRKDILPHNLKHASAHATKPSPHPYTALTVKLGDFGLSHTHPPTALSKVFHGSPHYQAPELWARAPHRPFPTDVWSAGVVLYALVGRRLPFGLDELEEWGRVFCKSDDSDGFYVDNTHQDKRGFEMDEKDHANRPPIPRPGVPSHVPFVVPEVMPPAIDHLLQRMFRINPTMRPTSREILADAWCGLTGCVSPSQNVPVLRGDIRRANEHPILSQPPSMPPPQHIADAYGPQDIYNIATLCTPPSTHVARATFCGSSLERMVRGRLGGDQCIEKVWASKLAAWVAWEGEGWVGASEQGKMVLEKGNVKGNMKEKEKEKRVGWLERKGWSQSLGRIKGADVRAHLAASFGHVAHAGQREHAEQVAQAVPAAQRGGGEHEKTVDPVVLHPNLRASSSSLRIKAEHKLPEIKRNQRQPGNYHPHLWNPNTRPVPFVSRLPTLDTLVPPCTSHHPCPNPPAGRLSSPSTHPIPFVSRPPTLDTPIPPCTTHHPCSNPPADRLSSPP